MTNTVGVTQDQVPWTRLSGTEIFSKARETMSQRRRHFHNFDHVVRIYWHAQYTLNLPYSRALDLAILTHDVIFDAGGDRELRSIEWLKAHLPKGEDDPDFPKAASYIRDTIEHRITQDPMMVLLDLADFSDPVVADKNTGLLRLEAQDLHGVLSPCFEISCEAYLSNLLHRFKSNAEAVPRDAKFLHEKILAGLVRTRGLLSDAIQNDEPLEM